MFYVSYGILTEFLRMNVILAYFCNGAKEIRLRINGNVTLETSHYAATAAGTSCTVLAAPACAYQAGVGDRYSMICEKQNAPLGAHHGGHMAIKDNTVIPTVHSARACT